MVASMRAAIGDSQGQFDRRIPERSRWPFFIGSLQNAPILHNNPFDRVLIAQAACEGLALVTADAKLHRYALARVRVIR